MSPISAAIDGTSTPASAFRVANVARSDFHGRFFARVGQLARSVCGFGRPSWPSRPSHRQEKVRPQASRIAVFVACSRIGSPSVSRNTAPDVCRTLMASARTRRCASSGRKAGSAPHPSWPVAGSAASGSGRRGGSSSTRSSRSGPRRSPRSAPAPAAGASRGVI